MINLEKYGFKSVLEDKVYVYPGSRLMIVRVDDMYSFHSNIDEDSSILHAYMVRLKHDAAFLFIARNLRDVYDELRMAKCSWL